MNTKTQILVDVSPDLAEYYDTVDGESREQLREIVEAELRRKRANETMRIVRDVSESAKARGMTPEILEQLLRDDPDNDE
jgi:broad-specificity NMP kinase